MKNEDFFIFPVLQYAIEIYVCILTFLLFLVCDDGYYGMNCTSICGNCSDNAACNKTTGECPGGCSSSWKPPFCNESKFNV